MQNLLDLIVIPWVERHLSAFVSLAAVLSHQRTELAAMQTTCKGAELFRFDSVEVWIVTIVPSSSINLFQEQWLVGLCFHAGALRPVGSSLYLVVA